MEPEVAIYGSHDTSITVRNGKGEYDIFELERWSRIRYDRIDKKENFKDIYKDLSDIIKETTGEGRFKTLYHQQVPFSHLEYLRELWGIETFKEVGHHLSHAASAFHQSQFDEALVISFDGGGFEGLNSDERVATFNVYLANRKEIKKIAFFPYDLGGSYGLLALPIKEIIKDQEDWGDRFLSFAGKKMGLVAYGSPELKYLESFKKFYRQHKHLSLFDFEKSINEETGLAMGVNTHSGDASYMIAATSQRAFEEVVWESVQPLIEKHRLPIVLTGGCGLNVLFNQKLKEWVDLPIYIPPNPSDCGLSFGMLALHHSPPPIELMYRGFPIIDYREEDFKDLPEASPHSLAQTLLSNKVLGVVRGRSEVGPRALGNRSLLCSPTDPSMKDRLNDRIKFRESFRPFAPIVQEERVDEYFHFKGKAEYMSYSPIVREEWRDRIPAVVHKDNSARVQTVGRDKSPFLWNLLEEWGKVSGVGVLLNTSFNVKGKPILTRVSDAIEVLNTTEIDGVVIEDRLLLK